MKKDPKCCCGNSPNYRFRDLCPIYHGVKFEEPYQYIFAPYIPVDVENTDSFNEHVMPLIDDLRKKIKGE